MIDFFSFWFGILVTINFVVLYRCSSKIRVALAVVTVLISFTLIFNNYYYSTSIANETIKFSSVWYFISLWNLGSVLFDSKLKRRLKFDESELYRYHIENVERFLDDTKHLYRTGEINETLKQQVLCDLIEKNQKNLSSYIKMQNKGWKFLPKVYKNTYESFALNFLKPLYNMSKGPESIPERIALNLRFELDNHYDVQQNVSQFTFNNFYNTYKDTAVQNTSNTSERIIVYGENLKDVYTKKNIMYNGSKISLIEWVLEWHKTNNEKLYLVSLDKAKELLNRKKSDDLSYPDLGFDYSINYKLASTDDILVVKNNLASKKQKDLGIINTADCYELSLTKEPKYKEFYDELKNEGKELKEDTMAELCS